MVRTHFYMRDFCLRVGTIARQREREREGGREGGRERERDREREREGEREREIPWIPISPKEEKNK